MLLVTQVVVFLVLSLQHPPSSASAPLLLPPLLHHLLPPLHPPLLSLFSLLPSLLSLLSSLCVRMSTTCLLLVLSHLYPSLMGACMALLVLDLTSHWYQMYSSFLVRKASHKDVAATDFFLMRWYYGSRPFMAYCCIGAELLYLVLYLDSDPLNQQVQVPVPYLGPTGVIRALGLVCLPGWALKQVTNVVQVRRDWAGEGETVGGERVRWGAR
ncbi:unnamed protein product [Closterium sp. Naga37s-1]|nr:unnamed protein product [Closterium sp. Naga37s-1]